MQITYPFHQTENNILDFLWLFDLLRILLYYFCESIILSCQFKLSKEKNFVETLHLVPKQYVCTCILLHLLLSANYCSFGRFGWRQKYGLSQISLLSFSFSHACLLGHPVYFDHQDFLRFSSDFSFQLFNAGKLWEML